MTVAVNVVKIGGVPELDVSISNCSEFDVPPPGVEFCTETAPVPALAMSDAGTWAVTCMLFTYWVARAVVPQ